MTAYFKEREELLGTKVVVKTKASEATWTVIDGVSEQNSDLNTKERYRATGLHGLDFSNLEVKCDNERKDRVNVWKLVLNLWPGHF